jgi:hypothetical protein
LDPGIFWSGGGRDDHYAKPPGQFSDYIFFGDAESWKLTNEGKTFVSFILFDRFFGDVTPVELKTHEEYGTVTTNDFF